MTSERTSLNGLDNERTQHGEDGSVKEPANPIQIQVICVLAALVPSLSSSVGYWGGGCASGGLCWRNSMSVQNGFILYRVSIVYEFTQQTHDCGFWTMLRKGIVLGAGISKWDRQTQASGYWVKRKGEEKATKLESHCGALTLRWLLFSELRHFMGRIRGLWI